MQELVLFRGLPGSGKTTAAKLWRESKDNTHRTCCIYAADDFFGESGQFNYQFNPRLLSVAHSKCILDTYLCLKKGHSVGVHNTFTTVREMLPYFDMASFLEVPMVVYKCVGTWKSVHNVPEATIEAMKARWEPFAGEEEIS